MGRVRVEEKGRTPKGSVSVFVYRDRLVLRWRYQRQRYTLYIGLPDTPSFRKVAESRAATIAMDMATGHFDSTLTKYKPQEVDCQSVYGLFCDFLAWRSPSLAPATRDKYSATAKHLKEYFKNKDSRHVRAKDGEDFRDWLLERQRPITVADRISLIRACWNWAIEVGRLEENPWKFVKVRAELRSPEPFTKEEIDKIIYGFETSPYYSCYAPYVRFLFGSGCRTGEAIGLRWGNVAQDCSSVTIVEAYRRAGHWDDTKNHKVRSLKLSPGVRQLLLNHRPKNAKNDELVFPSPTGKPINDNNFCKRAWAKVLSAVGVTYRKPYTTRHSALSHAIARGVSPARVAEMAGDRLETVLRAYVGNVEGMPETLDY